MNRRLHAAGNLEEKPYPTCNIILVREIGEDARSEVSGSEGQDLVGMEPPSYAAIDHPGMQQ